MVYLQIFLNIEGKDRPGCSCYLQRIQGPVLGGRSMARWPRNY